MHTFDWLLIQSGGWIASTQLNGYGVWKLTGDSEGQKSQACWGLGLTKWNNLATVYNAYSSVEVVVLDIYQSYVSRLEHWAESPVLNPLWPHVKCVAGLRADTGWVRGVLLKPHPFSSTWKSHLGLGDFPLCHNLLCFGRHFVLKKWSCQHHSTDHSGEGKVPRGQWGRLPR